MHLGFFEDGKTCINCNINNSDNDMSAQEISNKILKFYDNYEENSKIIHSRIREIINFDFEFSKLKLFVTNLI
jgi:hypothetical protein